jgi:hypothetical protein
MSRWAFSLGSVASAFTTHPYALIHARCWIGRSSHLIDGIHFVELTRLTGQEVWFGPVALTATGCM